MEAAGRETCAYTSDRYVWPILEEVILYFFLDGVRGGEIPGDPAFARSS